MNIKGGKNIAGNENSLTESHIHNYFNNGIEFLKKTIKRQNKELEHLRRFRDIMVLFICFLTTVSVIHVSQYIKFNDVFTKIALIIDRIV